VAREAKIGKTGASDAVSHEKMSARRASFLALLLLFAAARSCRCRLGFLRCLVLCLCAVCSGCILHSSILSRFAHVSCAHNVPGRVSIPSAFSGSAAICLPSLPTAAINLPTSALFSVLNFNVVPDTGSNAFTSRVALGTRGASSPVFSSLSAAVRFLFLLAYFSVSRFGMWYLVVTRACVVGKNHYQRCCPASKRWVVDLRTVAGRAWNSSLACRCHSSMVSRYTIFMCCDCGCGAVV
jgi:hypothetical protein